LKIREKNEDNTQEDRSLIKGIIFDMDGVIIDSEPIHYKLFKKYTTELGINVTDEEYDTFIGSTNLVIYKTLKQRYDINRELEDIIREYDKKCDEYYDDAEDEKPIEGIDTLIKELHINDLKLAVASSSSIKAINSVTKLFKLDKYFHKLVSGNMLENPKPAPDIFLIAAQELGLKPSECLVIEDSRNGVMAAKAAGMKCIGFRNPNSGNQDISSADVIIDSFNDISCEKILELF
jgi:HAD superfamily hydrolase (TIGR01509 family)